MCKGNREISKKKKKKEEEKNDATTKPIFMKF